MVEIKSENKTNDFQREIQWSVDTLLKLEEEFPKKKALMDEGDSIFLQVVLFKIPVVDEMVKKRLSLKHPPYAGKPEVCFIVRDCLRKDRIKRTPDEMIDYTVERFEDFFNRQKVTGISNILPYYQLRKEYDTFELKRKLANRFDVFLCSSSLNAQNGFFRCFGKIFIDKNKYPISVHLPPVDAEYDAKVNREIQSAIASTVFRVKEGSSNYSIKIGNTLNKKEDIIENLEYVMDKIVNSDLIPGGLKNVRYIQIKTAKSKVVPIYISLDSGRKVPVPYVEPNVPVKESVEGEVSTIRGKKVTVLPNGQIFLTPMKDDVDDESSENDDEEEDDDFDDGDEEEEEEDVKFNNKTEKKDRKLNVKKEKKGGRKKVEKDSDDEEGDGEEEIETFEQKYLSDWSEAVGEEKEEEEEETPEKGQKRKKNFAGKMTKKGKKNEKTLSKTEKGESPMLKKVKKEAKNVTTPAKKTKNDRSQPDKKSKQMDKKQTNQKKVGKDTTNKKQETLNGKQAKKQKIVDMKEGKKKMLEAKMGEKMEKAKMKVSGFEKKVKTTNMDKKKRKKA